MADQQHFELDALLKVVHDNRASDLLLSVGSPPLCRIDGEMRSMAGVGALTADDTERLVAECIGQDAVAELHRDREYDFSFDWNDLARFRGNAFYQRKTLSLALRRIPTAIPTPAMLGLPQAVQHFAQLPQGLVLVTGPTGSGKSTTQASLIDLINSTRRCHIVTIEDPIEYLHTNRHSAISQREVGDDTHSFGRALRSALREDPDVLLVGEMRDTESIQTALTIAETGHLVFATVHTNDTSTAIDRIVDSFGAGSQTQIRVQLAASLVGVTAQRLIARNDGGGMVAAFEVLVANSAVRNLVREGKTAQIRNIIMTHQKDGMQTLEMSLNALVAAGMISYEAALNHTLLPKEIKQPAPPPPPPQQPVASNGRR